LKIVAIVNYLYPGEKKLKTNEYAVMEDQVSSGIDAGLQLAYTKHETPSKQQIADLIFESVMNNITDYFVFEDVLNDEPVCDHNWVSADNEVVTGGEVCTKCFMIRATQND